VAFIEPITTGKLAMAGTDHYVTTHAPEGVTAAALARGLGSLVGTREGASRGQAAGVSGAIAAGCLVLLIPCWLVLRGMSPLSASFSLVDAVYRGLVVGLLGSLGWAVRALLTARRSWYLYTRGVIEMKGSTAVRPVAWTDAVELKTIHRRRGDTNIGAVVGYQLAGRDGTTLTIPLRASQGGRDPFIDQILAAAREHSCPIA
jgi:hypothetical protein